MGKEKRLRAGIIEMMCQHLSVQCSMFTAMYGTGVGSKGGFFCTNFECAITLYLILYSLQCNGGYVSTLNAKARHFD